jgi:hypothetical protein
MPATRGSAKRKRGSDSSSDSSPAASSSQRGGASADRPSLVDCEGHWATNLRKARDDGHFLDCVLVASGGAEIRAHKAVLISHSPFLHGLFTSGLAESQQDRVELSTIDGRAAGAVVDCFYSGKVELTAASVCAVIRTAHELQVDAVERAAAQYFVDRLDPATAVSALAGFASEFVASANGRALQRKCLEYAQAHFGECVAEPAFLEQLTEAATVAKLLEGDEISVSETEVLAAVRAWVQHDAAARRPALRLLLPCVRFPTLPDTAQVDFFADPLFLSLMQQSAESAAVAGQIAKECSAAFGRSAEAASCQRRKVRSGYARVTQVARTPCRFGTSTAADWGFGGSEPDAIDVTPSKGLLLKGLTVGEREELEGRGHTAIVRVYEHGTDRCLRDNSTPIKYGAAVDGWCDLILDSPVTLQAGRRYELVVTCSDSDEGGRKGDAGEPSVECEGGLTVVFQNSSRDENATSVDDGQIAHLLYTLL